MPEIKSYLIGARLYEPKTGRYLIPDPLPGYIARFDSFNKYAHGCRVSGIFMEPRCNQTRKKGNQGIFQGGTYYPSEYFPEKIKGEHFYKDRVYAYVDDWIRRNDPGPIILMVRGIQHRFEEGEKYANKYFKGHRMLVLPSYEGKEPKFLRGVTDAIRTLGDRASPFRNLDLPELWRYLKNKGCPVIISIHESGALHDLAKNVPGIIAATKAGQNIPLIVPTSGDIGEHNMWKLHEAGVRISLSVTHPRDLVGKLEKPWWEADPLSKVWSSIGALFGGNIPRIPGWGYDLSMHAQHYKELNEIIQNEKTKHQSGTDLTSTDEDIKSAAEKVRRKLGKDRRRNDNDYYPFLFFPPPPPPLPVPIGAGIGLHDPFKSVESQLGGIELAVTGEFIGIPGNITGAVFDQEKQCLVLLEFRYFMLPLKLSEL